jgi:hypothetical protein
MFFQRLVSNSRKLFFELQMLILDKRSADLVFSPFYFVVSLLVLVWTRQTRQQLIAAFKAQKNSIKLSFSVLPVDIYTMMLRTPDSLS